MVRHLESATSGVRQPPVIRFGSLSHPDVVHGVTTRTADLPLFGNMSFMVGGSPEQVQENRNAWAEAIGYDPSRLVLGRQVHECAVVPVDDSHAGSGAESVETSIRRVDGLMTDTPGLPIGVMAADCVPLLIHDPVAGVVAAIHAGWRGTVAGIAAQSITELHDHYGSQPEHLRVVLGPSICSSCYQVGDEVVDHWERSPHRRSASPVETKADGLYFDLREANRGQLAAMGVPDASIEISDVCTRCSNGAMFSRRGLGPRSGLFTSIIMLVDNSVAQGLHP